MKLLTSLAAALGLYNLVAAQQEPQIVLDGYSAPEPEVMSVAIIGIIQGPLK